MKLIKNNTYREEVKWDELTKDELIWYIYDYQQKLNRKDQDLENIKNLYIRMLIWIIFIFIIISIIYYFMKF